MAEQIGIFLLVKIRYNAPVILTYTLICAVVTLAGEVTSGSVTRSYFMVYPSMDTSSFGSTVLEIWRLLSHIAGHQNWTHFMSNFTFVLLLGPMLEEKYGSGRLLVMILFTGFITGVLNTLFFSTGLMGASGIVFMFILLSSFANIRSGDIPLTFILVVSLFLIKEVLDIWKQDNVSQFAHILGGIAGSFFGFRSQKA